MTGGDEGAAAALAAAKAAARAAAREARAAAHAAGAGAAAEAAAARFLAARFVEAAGGPEGAVVSGYRPIRTELDPTPLMRALHAAGARLAVPVIERAGAPLLFRAWTPESAMIAGAFGAETPAEGDWLRPSLVIAPLLAFDAAGGRVGYGGGFYDRTLRALRGEGIDARAVGFAFDAQEVAAAPMGPDDGRLDAVTTETRTLRVPGGRLANAAALV